MRYEELELLSKKGSHSTHLESLCQERLASIVLKDDQDENSILDALEYCFLHQMYPLIISWYEQKRLDINCTCNNVHAYYVWSLLFNGEERSRIVSALNLFEDKMGDIVALYPIKAFIYKNEGRIFDAITLLKSALILMPSRLEYFISTSHWILGSCHYMTGNLVESRLSYQSAKQHSLLCQHNTIAVLSICCMAEMDIQNANMTSANKLLKEAIILSKEITSDFTGAVNLGLCEVAYYQNNQDHAKELAELIIKSSPNTFTGIKLMAHVMLAKILTALGDENEAKREMMKAALELQYIKKQSLFTLYFEMEQVYLHLIHNDVQLATPWVESRKLSLESFYNDLQSDRKSVIRGINTYYVYAWYLYQADKVQEAMELAKHIEHFLRDGDRRLLYIKVLALCALITFKSDGKMLADNSAKVKKLLELCTTYKVVMIIYEYGADMWSLLRAYSKKNQTDSSVITIIENMTTLPLITQHASLNSFDLSERELAILAQLDSQLSIADIAKLEYVTVNTVKTHIKNIYSKMNVHNRKNAVKLGRQNHLI